MHKSNTLNAITLLLSNSLNAISIDLSFSEGSSGIGDVWKMVVQPWSMRLTFKIALKIRNARDRVAMTHYHLRESSTVSRLPQSPKISESMYDWYNWSWWTSEHTTSSNILTHELSIILLNSIENRNDSLWSVVKLWLSTLAAQEREFQNTSWQVNR